MSLLDLIHPVYCRLHGEEVAWGRDTKDSSGSWVGRGRDKATIGPAAVQCCYGWAASTI